MKNIIHIYSDIKIDKFMSQLNLGCEFLIRDISILKKNFHQDNGGIIILSKKESFENLVLTNIKKDYIIFFNKNFIKTYSKKNLNFIKIPKSINYLKNVFKSFVSDLQFEFHDILIHNKILKNINNALEIQLTEIEKNILIHLIQEKITTKSEIKETILNLKSEIQTNSLESHLSRIRKKIHKINSLIRIESKKENLSIFNL